MRLPRACDLIMCWNPRGPENGNYKYVHFPIEKEAEPPGSMCVCRSVPVEQWLAFSNMLLTNKSNRGRYAAPTWEPDIWGLTLRWLLKWQGSLSCINNINHHWIDAGCQRRGFQAVTRLPQRIQKSTTTKGEKKPDSSLEHQHLEFLSCISYYNLWLQRAEIHLQEEFLSEPWGGFHLRRVDLATRFSATHTVWVKWRLFWAWSLGSVPTSLWKWDEPIGDWSKV